MPRGIPASTACEVCKGPSHFLIKPRADVKLYACAPCLMDDPYFALARKFLGIMESEPCDSTQ